MSAPESEPDLRATLRFYLAAHFVYFAGAAMQGVLFAWTVTQLLKAPGTVVGLAQTLAFLPLFLVPFGGAAADGRALKPYVARLQLIQALPPLAMAFAAATGQVTIWAAIAYAFLGQSVAAFLGPARDALLTHVVPKHATLTQIVANATGAAFAGQMTGFVLAAFADSWGLTALAALQASLFSLAAILTSRMRPQEPHGHGAHSARRVSQHVRDTRAGFDVLMADERVRTVTLFVALSSLAMNSLWLVGLPLLVRDVYHGTSAQLSGLFFAFMAGTTFTAMTLGRLKPIKRPGRAMMNTTLSAILVFTGLHFAPPFWIVALLIFGWGLGAGMGMVMSRGIVQDASDGPFRARLLALFQFAQMIGGAPGSIVLGFAAAQFGILNAIVGAVVWVGALWVTFRIFSPLWTLRLRDKAPEVSAEAAPLAPPPLTMKDPNPHS